jgi:threonine dehydrogenase-like Zn-dependent dehydrogenase
MQQGAGRVLAVDRIPDRLETARRQGAETVDFDAEDPVETVQRLTNGIGVDRVIDAVGVDAEKPHREGTKEGLFQPGGGPSQALEWAVQMAAKAGSVGIIGVYPMSAETFPVGMAMNKNLTVRMGNCNHRRYLAGLVDMVQSGALRLSPNITRDEPMDDVIAAYRAFDERDAGWLKVKLTP